MTEQERDRHISEYLQIAFSDERLAMLLAHCSDGKLSLWSRHCFSNFPRAIPPFEGASFRGIFARADCSIAMRAFVELGHFDVTRRRLLIPMIRAEMKRREFQRSQPDPEARCSSADLVARRAGKEAPSAADSELKVS